MQALLLHDWRIKQSTWSEADLSLASIDKVSSPRLYKVAKEEHDSLSDLIAQILNDVSEPGTMVIGGLIAMPLQKITEKIKNIVFIGNPLCFVNKENGPSVFDKKHISAFQASLKVNADKTLKYFPGLIAHGDSKLKKINKTICKYVATKEDKATLSIWLDQMLATSFERNLKRLSQNIKTQTDKRLRSCSFS
jgi:hypothetical protein